MKLYLADDEKLNTFTLPEKIAESFLFSYTPDFSNIEVFMNIYAKDNSWYFKNNDDVKLDGDNPTGEKKLSTYEIHEIQIKGVHTKFKLFSYPICNNNFVDKNTENISEITIGKDSNNDIIYNNSLTLDNHAKIYIEEGTYFIETQDENAYIYLNKIRVKAKSVINVGDIIFINGLKIVWMRSFIRLYLANDNVSFSTKLLDKEKTTVDNTPFLNYDMPENDSPLYHEDDFFFHKPRLTISYEDENIKIDQPPKSEVREDIPLVFQLGAGGTMLVFSFVNLFNAYNKFKEGGNKTTLITTCVTSIAMILCSFLLPRLLQSYNKRKAKKREALRQQKYTEYLNTKANDITKVLKYESQALYDNNPSSKECYDIVVGTKERIWEREISDEDFLTYRVGIGNVESKLKVETASESFTLDEDDLLKRAIQLGETSKELKKVPMTVSLSENYISSIICNTENAQDYLNGILLQLLCLHNPKDLKIVFLTTEKNSYKWEYLKLMPHLLSEDRTIRYFATNEEEAKSIIKEIESLYNERKDEIKEKDTNDDDYIETTKQTQYKNFRPYYLIITDNYRKYQNLEFISKIINFKKNVGFSLLMIDKSLRNLPNDCNKYTYVTNTTSCVFEKNYSKSNQLSFEPEFFENLNMEKVAKELSNIPVQTSSEIYNLPQSLSFLEMYNVGSIEQLNILNKWYTSNPMSSLSCPIGVNTSGEIFKLDLHEKYHGPHGLIAGSTGSGKSEFIITYILSMAVNYHPDEVKFVLIDYKGGGLAGAFENRETGVKIPHLAGTITNLDISEMNRTLVSIESELKRRQIKFNEARDQLGESTIDIYKYQKYYREGLLKDPIPHLFIISDEFAELKSQQPEFMDELISTARIGRSLGVHLILATQKPSGVVNDQIWSNSKFKICLKVQTKADSMEMLKRDEAASIKETGRFYLQVGYDELFELGQSAWSGATYTPTEKVIKKFDDSIMFINNIGEVIKNVNDHAQKDKNNETKKGDQLTNIVKYLADIAKDNNIQTKSLWLDSIPGEIYLNNLMQKYSYTTTPFEINPIIGEYDDPKNQKQGLFTNNFTKDGNLLIYGSPGSGKENLITTLITSTCIKHTPEEVNYYIIDFGSETTKRFIDFPQVGDIAFSDEIEKINNLYTILSNEIEKRKELFAEYMGSYTAYIKDSGKKLPNIICTIIGYENFQEMYPAVAEKYINLFKDGAKFGVNFAITFASTTGLRAKVIQLFPNKLTLKLNNADDYRYVINAPRNLIPSNHFGRGLVELDDILEFQTAYVTKPDDITKTIKDIATQLKASYTKRAPKIPVLPRFLTADKLLNKDFNLSNVPVGISKNKLQIIDYDFNKYNLTPVITNNVGGNIHFIYGLIELLKKIPTIKIRIIDVLKIYKEIQGVDVFNNDFDTLIKQIKLEAIDDDKNKKINVFIIIGLGAFKNNVEDKTLKIFNDVFEKLKTYKTNKFIIYDDYTSFKGLETETWFRSNVNSSNGIWLGEGAGNQFAIKMPELTTDERKLSFEEMAFVLKEGNHKAIRYVVDKEFDDEK